MTHCWVMAIWSFSKWPLAAISDLIRPEMAPFDPPSPKPNMKGMGWGVAELWPFEVFHTWTGDRTWDIGDRTCSWFYILSNAAMQCIGQTTTAFIDWVPVVMARKLTYFEHIMRKKSESLEKQTMQGTTPGSHTRASRQKTTWMDNIEYNTIKNNLYRAQWSTI